MSWIKTLWLWKEVALCLLLGSSLVWGHMWWIAGVWYQQPETAADAPSVDWIFHPMCYSGMTAWTQHHSLWLAVPAPIGEPGPAGPGGQGLFKEQDTKTYDPGVLTHTSALLRPLRPTGQNVKMTLSTDILLFYCIVQLPCTVMRWQHLQWKLQQCKWYINTS